MGRFVNPDNSAFQKAVNSEIYVDKTGFLSYTNKVIDTKQAFICNSRPRRFGKSTTADMLAAYYSKGCDSENLFADLAVSDTEDFHKYLNKYDVIHFDVQWFITENNISEIVNTIQNNIVEELKKEYPDILDSDVTGLPDAMSIINQETGNRFIVIIDEWDAMFRECKGADEILDNYILLLRSLFKSSLTDQLFAGVYMTGILPIKKYGHESAVSDFYEYSMVEPRPLQEYIGFTTEEVKSLCQKYDKDYTIMQEWYDGYTVGGVHVYNPKSVMESILRDKYSSYWTKTETCEALRNYIDMNFDGLKDTVVDMLGGEKCEVDTGSFQNDMTSMKSRDDVLTLLIHLGYLAYDEDTRCVSIPNVEIREEFIRAIKNGNRTELMKAVLRSDSILQATWEKDGRKVAEIVNEIHNEDTASVFYNNEQALRSVIKMAYLSSMDYYSKMEEIPAGKGVADILFFPKAGSQKPALIVELKWNQSEQKALNQILDKKYTSVLKGYQGDVLLVGINYNEKSKEHGCVIQEMK